jgi:HEAT repeat protein
MGRGIMKNGLMLIACLCMVSCATGSSPTGHPIIRPIAVDTEDIVERCILILMHGPQYSLDEPSKVDAVVALGIIRDARAVDVLLEYMKHAPPDLGGSQFRQPIANSLGWIGDARAVPALVEVLANDSNVHTRNSAASALGKIGGEEAVKGLETVLKDDPSLSETIAPILERLNSGE